MIQVILGWATNLSKMELRIKLIVCSIIDFYDTFNELKRKLGTETTNKYQSTDQFMERLKLIMAKLAVMDTLELLVSLLRIY